MARKFKIQGEPNMANFAMRVIEVSFRTPREDGGYAERAYCTQALVYRYGPCAGMLAPDGERLHNEFIERMGFSALAPYIGFGYTSVNQGDILLKDENGEVIEVRGEFSFEPKQEI
jgi:hypothetical protein